MMTDLSYSHFESWFAGFEVRSRTGRFGWGRPERGSRGSQLAPSTAMAAAHRFTCRSGPRELPVSDVASERPRERHDGRPIPAALPEGVHFDLAMAKAMSPGSAASAISDSETRRTQGQPSDFEVTVAHRRRAEIGAPRGQPLRAEFDFARLAVIDGQRVELGVPDVRVRRRLARWARVLLCRERTAKVGSAFLRRREACFGARVEIPDPNSPLAMGQAQEGADLRERPDFEQIDGLKAMADVAPECPVPRAFGQRR